MRTIQAFRHWAAGAARDARHWRDGGPCQLIDRCDLQAARQERDALVGGASPLRLVNCVRLRALGLEWAGRLDALARTEGMGYHTATLIQRWRLRLISEIDDLLGETGARRISE